MKKINLDKSTLVFLSTLAKNNNRDWFQQHKEEYLDAHQNLCDIADALIKEMNKHDQLENESGKKSLFRIYKDVRFSKDKSPYSPRFSFGLKRATKLRRGGYYIHIQPGKSYLACGFFAPNPEDLKRIRQDIELNYVDWNKILSQKKLKNSFGAMQGEKLLTAPKGFPKEHPAIELLRYKQFIFRHPLNDSEILANDFVIKINDLFKIMRPWLDYMSEVLTTDANGELIR